VRNCHVIFIVDLLDSVKFRFILTLSS
jgi:hypothetical protein